MTDDDILDQLEDEIDALCSDDDSEACEQLEDAVEEMAEAEGDEPPAEMPDDPLTYSDFTGPHSYRNYSTEMVERLIATVGTERGERGFEASARDGIDHIEAGRWASFLEAASRMFNRLDDDERRLFMRRNPGVVEWVTVFDEANGYDPMERWRNDARVELGPNGARDPPKFDRGRGSATVGGDSLLSDMITRRRSYRNWTPGEFQDILDMERVELSLGMAREIGFRTPEIRDTLREEGAFPVEVNSKEVTRELLGRVESGRFQPALKELMTFYAPLDRDEARTFSRRNPGIIMWLSVHGESQDQIHQEQLNAHTYPTLGEK